MSSTSIDIYDGRHFIGHVVERDNGGRCEAHTVSGRALGMLPSLRKAAKAVYDAACEQRREAAA